MTRPPDLPPSGGAPRAAVVVPHYNDAARLERCLLALRPQVGPDVEVVVIDVRPYLGTDVEVVVIDNGSAQSLDRVRTAWPELRIVVERLKGAALARNRGVAETTAPRIFFLDCDCVPAPDWLETALEVAPRADLVGGRITLFDETPGQRSGPEAFETVFAFDNRGYIERKGFSVTANLLITRAAFDVVGGFRPGLSEDLDWCQRARAAGFRLIYEGRLQVAHPTRSDWPALRRKWRRTTEEAWGLEGRDIGARALWAARALAMVPSIAAHTPRVLRHPDLAGAERGRALATLARLRLQRCAWMLAQAASREG